MFQETQISAGNLTLNLAVGPGHGPPLLLLHGVARCWQDYVAIAPVLAARWQVVALDFRGHGNSGRANSYRVVDYVADAVHVLQAHVREPAVIYGHSLGALVAAAVAARREVPVRAVVLEDPPFGLLGPTIRQTVFHGMFAAYQQLAGTGQSVEQLAAALSEVTLTPPGKAQRLKLSALRDPAALRFMAKCLSRLDPATMTPLVEGRWLEGYDQEALLRAVDCPALLMQGETGQGGMLSDTEAERAVTQLQRVTHVPVSGAGHLIHTMHAETTLRIVSAFLESL